MHTISISEAKNVIRHVAIRMNKPTMFWGAAGVGKTQAGEQVCKEDGIIQCDIRLGQYDSVDLRGFPGVDANTSQTVWHPPATMPFKGNPNFPTNKLILVTLDEINAAVPAVAGVAYQFVLERRIGEHEVMDNVRIIAMGNRESDRGVVNRMPMPLANRFTHYEIGVDVDDWGQHMSAKGKPAIGVAFHMWRSKSGKGLLHTFDPASTEKAFASPRSWEVALDYYADALLPDSIKQASMAGAVGDGPALEFWKFTEVWKSIVPISEIIKDPTGVPVPEEASMQYATTVNVSGHMSPKNITPLQTFLERMDPVFCVLAWQLAIKRDDKLLDTKQFLDFSKKYRAVFQ